MTKIIVLNQATTDHHYLGIDALSRSTWSNITHPDVKVIHYYGTLDTHNNQITTFPTVEKNQAILLKEKYLTDSYLFCGTNDVLTGEKDPRGEKLMIALEYCYKNLEFDFVVRCCNTTYNDIVKMHRVLSDMPKECVYDGGRNMYDYKYYFVGGWHAYMSRDTVGMVVENKNKYLSLKYPEDLALGILLMHDLKYTNFDREIIPTGCFAYIDYDFSRKYNIENNIFAYRFRHDTLDLYTRFHKHILKNEK